MQLDARLPKIKCQKSTVSQGTHLEPIPATLCCVCIIDLASHWGVWALKKLGALQMPRNECTAMGTDQQTVFRSAWMPGRPGGVCIRQGLTRDAHQSELRITSIQMHIPCTQDAHKYQLAHLEPDPCQAGLLPCSSSHLHQQCLRGIQQNGLCLLNILFLSIVETNIFPLGGWVLLTCADRQN